MVWIVRLLAIHPFEWPLCLPPSGSKIDTLEGINHNFSQSFQKKSKKTRPCSASPFPHDTQGIARPLMTKDTHCYFMSYTSKIYH